MTIDFIQYSLFLVIICLQLYFFNKTRQKINEFNLSIPEIKQLEIFDFKLSDTQIEEFISTGFFSDPDNDQVNTAEIKLNPVRLISTIDKQGLVFTEVLSSLNKYLVRNRHSVADFNLIKDIVERNTDTVEDEVNLTLSTPLYLGLMGTMLGIVIGLFSMSYLFDANISDADLSNGIGVLLSSVKIAMIASFVGLALTIYNSSFIFKGTKYAHETKKNAFYTFIQIELLPSLNQGLSSTFESLQRNLSKFNEKFDSNLDRLSTVFDKNYESILLQKDLIKQLDRTKVSEMTKYNLQVLKELNVAVVHFEKFNSLFDNVNNYLNGTYQLTDKTNELLERTGNFEKIAQSIWENISQNTQLVSFLSTHFQNLESHKQMVDDAVVKVSFGVKDIFNELSKSLHDSSRILSEEATSRNIHNGKVFDDFTEAFKQAFISQADAVKNAIEEKKSNLDYLPKLENILEELKACNEPNAVLEKLFDEVVSIKASIEPTVNDNSSDLTMILQDKHYSELIELNSKMSANNKILANIENRNRKSFLNIFGKKKL